MLGTQIHLFKAMVLPTFTYGTEIREGNLRNSHWTVFEKGMKMHMMSHVKVCSSTKVEGVKTNTPPKSNTYKRLPITNTLLP